MLGCIGPTRSPRTPGPDAALQLLTHGTPDQVRADVRRVKKLLGPHLIVSPSHEAILPNVPPQNVAALAEAAVEPD